MVVTVRDGRIVRMQDHRSSADALADAGLAPKPKPLPPAPFEHSQPDGYVLMVAQIEPGAVFAED
jgi:hypothetical protein